MTSHPEFDSKTTATEVAAAFSNEIKGKTILVTGVSPGGIGAATAEAIASQAPGYLILASRTRKNLDAVENEIKKRYPGVSIYSVNLDLGSLDSIKTAATDIRCKTEVIDVLINNAGLTLPTRDPVTTPGGITVDKQLFVNHVGPFAFTELLLPMVLGPQSSQTRVPRIINVASHGHRLSPIRFSDFAFERDIYEGVPESERPPQGVPVSFLRLKDGYPGFVGYGQSKTANILYALELMNRFQKKHIGALALSLHPGTIDTGLSRDWDEQGRNALGSTAPNGVWKSIAQGAATTLVAAFDPELKNVKNVGKHLNCYYLSDCQLADGVLAQHANDPSSATRLWTQTEKMLGIVSKL